MLYNKTYISFSFNFSGLETQWATNQTGEFPTDLYYSVFNSYFKPYKIKY